MRPEPTKVRCGWRAPSPNITATSAVGTRGSRGNLAEINGITGASVGAGRTLKVTLDLADALFDAGYKLHIDAAAEDMRDSPSEVVVPLTSAGASRPAAGRSYIRSFTYDM